MTIIPRHTAGCCIYSVVAFTGGRILNPTLTTLSPDIPWGQGAMSPLLLNPQRPPNSKGLISIYQLDLCNLHNNPWRYKSFYNCGNWGPERSCDLLVVTRLVSGTVKITMTTTTIIIMIHSKEAYPVFTILNVSATGFFFHIKKENVSFWMKLEVYSLSSWAMVGFFLLPVLVVPKALNGFRTDESSTLQLRTFFSTKVPQYSPTSSSIPRWELIQLN